MDRIFEIVGKKGLKNFLFKLVTSIFSFLKRINNVINLLLLIIINFYVTINGINTLSLILFRILDRIFEIFGKKGLKYWNFLFKLITSIFFSFLKRINNIINLLLLIIMIPLTVSIH